MNFTLTYFDSSGSEKKAEIEASDRNEAELILGADYDVDEILEVEQ